MIVGLVLFEDDVSKFDGGSFGLEADCAFGDGGVFAFVDEGAVDVDGDFVAVGGDGHGVPFAERFFLGIGDAVPAGALVVSGGFDAPADAPEVAGFALTELGFDADRPSFAFGDFADVKEQAAVPAFGIGLPAPLVGEGVVFV